MGIITGKKIQKFAKWILMVAMLLDCLWLLSKLTQGIQPIVYRNSSVTWLSLMLPYFLTFVFYALASYVVCLIIEGFGCIVEDNAKKAQAADEMNKILRKRLCADDDYEYLPAEDEE